MKTVCLQFQPSRAPKISETNVSVLMLRIALAEEAVQTFTVQRNRSNQDYVNYLFVGHAVGSIWNAVRLRALRHRRFGAGLRRACIVTAEGSHGWQDYRLLHHFDSKQTLDKLSVPNKTLQPTSRARR